LAYLNIASVDMSSIHFACSCLRVILRNEIAFTSRDQLKESLQRQNVTIPIDVYYPPISVAAGPLEAQARILSVQNFDGAPYFLITRQSLK